MNERIGEARLGGASEGGSDVKRGDRGPRDLRSHRGKVHVVPYGVREPFLNLFVSSPVE
jgi:hypothetical protein